MNANFLIFGAGSKFGLHLSDQLEMTGATVYAISSASSETETKFQIDWLTCDFMSVEKIIKKIPKIDVVIFNQNYCHVPEIADFSLAKPAQWLQGRHWIQAHFVNSVLPCQVLNSLIFDGKFCDSSLALWMLSGVIVDDHKNMLGYRSQKMLNAQIIRSARQNNLGSYVGFDPGTITEDNQSNKARILAHFLMHHKPSEFCYEFNTDLTAIVPHTKILFR